MKERGNILFLILLAVVLFAALAYAVTSSMRGGGKDAKTESLQAQVSTLLSFFNQLDAAVMRMQLSGGLKPEMLSFQSEVKRYNGTIASAYANSNCTDNTCRVFHVDGGGVPAMNFEKYGVAAPTAYGATVAAPGYFDFFLMQWPGAGTSANDIIMRINAMPRAFCEAVNAQMGITAQPNYTGTYSGVSTPANWDDPGYVVTTNASQLYGVTTFSGYTIQAGTPGEYCSIFHLVLTR